MAFGYVLCTTSTTRLTELKDATPTHDLSNVVYIFKCHCGNDNVDQTSQGFHLSESSMS